MPLSVGATLLKVAQGEVEHFTRDEAFGLANTRFLREHAIPLEFQQKFRHYIATAVRYRNSNHPHVKKLGLTSIMASHDEKLKALYSQFVEKAMYSLAQVVKTHRTAKADEDDDDDDGGNFTLDPIAREAYMSQLRASLKQSKPDFRTITEEHLTKAYKAGRMAGIAKLSAVGIKKPPPPNGYDDEDEIADRVDDDAVHYDQLLDDVGDDADEAVKNKAPDESSYMSMVEAALFGQMYRTDMFTNGMYRAAQDGQVGVFDEQKKDPAGPEWKYKWKAVIDDATCDICADLNDEEPQYLDAFEYDPGGVHIFCRCDLDPVPPEEDEDEPEEPGPEGPDEGPDNEGTPPGGNDEVNAPPEVAPQEWPLDTDLTQHEEWEHAGMLAAVNPKTVDTYFRDTGLGAKMTAMSEDKTLIGRYLNQHYNNPVDLIPHHFEQRFNIKVGGAYLDNNFWAKLDKTNMAREMDVLSRTDKELEVLKKASVFGRVMDLAAQEKWPTAFLSREPLSIKRWTGKKMPDTGKPIKPGTIAWYSPGTNSVYFWDGTIAYGPKMASIGLPWKINKTIIHEFGHALARNANVSPDKELRNMWRELQLKWLAINGSKEISDEFGKDRFVTSYGYDAWYDKTGRKEEEDLVEGMGHYVLTPKIFDANDALSLKYRLLKDSIFEGREFSGYQQKPIL